MKKGRNLIVDANDMLSNLLPEGWDHDGFGFDACLICPHGWTLEMDGWHIIEEADAEELPEYGAAGARCVSPIRGMGL